MPTSKFVHLHAHTEYSLLDGLTRVDDLVRHTAERGDPAVAKTDHGSLFATLKFLDAGKKYGIKTIVGMEAYLAPRGRKDRTTRDTAHLTLLAADEEGYRNLRILSTLAYTEGTYYKQRIDNELLYTYNKGIICLSGCLSGVIQGALMDNDYDGALKAATEYRQIFGDRFYLEMMRHNLGPQADVEAGMFRIQQALGSPFVATNDSHYLRHEDCTAHEVLLCIGTQNKMSNEKRFRLDTPEFYVKSDEEMREIFRDIPQACDETIRIAERVDLKLPKPTFHIPFYPVPNNTKAEQRTGRKPSPEEYLRALCYGGLAKRYGERAASPEVKDRLDYELSVISEMGFASYFLIVWDFIKFARDNDVPVGPGRGSAVGSIVSYALRITDLDPLEHGLIFERFLNPERVNMPDIDTDFCIEGREKVVQYVAEKYGRDRVASISTFGTLQSRAAIKDTARVYDLALTTTNYLSKLVPSGPKGLSIAEAREKIEQIQNLERQEPLVRRVLDMAQNVEKNVRSAGTHAAAIVISDAPLTDYVALCTAPGTAKDNQILNTQEDMNWVEKLGLVKMDFLGLRNLTVMETAAKSIRKKRPDFRLEDIPINDARTYAMLAEGNTDGVFQLESGGMKKLMRDMRPDRFNDIVAAISLYRPGPMELIPQYVAGKRGEASAPSLHPALDSILSDTYSVPVYQEQVMQMARQIAGYTMSEADFLRKIMGKKKLDEVAGAKVKFVESAVKNGVAEDVATKIFNFIEPFAGYGFNKSHAAAYGWITYQTAWLKRNYPSEYFAALLTSVEDTADKMAEYVSAAKQHDITVTPPDINESGLSFTPTEGGIRFGLASAKGLTSESLRSVISERETNGPYTSLDDLVRRNRTGNLETKLQQKHVELMTKAGALDSFGEDRGRMLKWIEPIFARYNAEERHRQEGFISLFGDEGAQRTPTILKKERRSSARERLAWEYETLGVYVSGHPADAVRRIPSLRDLPTVANVKNDIGTDEVRIAGVLRDITKRTTKDGKPMAKAKLEDISGTIDVIVFSNRMRRVEDALQGGKLVVVTGERKHVERRPDDVAPETTSADDGIDTISHVEFEGSTEIIVTNIELVAVPADDAA